MKLESAPTDLAELRAQIDTDVDAERQLGLDLALGVNVRVDLGAELGEVGRGGFELHRRDCTGPVRRRSGSSRTILAVGGGSDDLQAAGRPAPVNRQRRSVQSPPAT